MTTISLANEHCQALKGAQHALSDADVSALLASLPDWSRVSGGNEISRNFRFPDFVHALAFVNALAFIAERENHHPDLELGWGRVLVKFSTHDVGGLSRNDFICAAKADTLFNG